MPRVDQFGRLNRRSATCIACIAIILNFAGYASAITTSQWTGGTDATWETPTNWTNGSPNSSTVAAYFTGAPTNHTITLNGSSKMIASLTIDDGAGGATPAANYSLGGQGLKIYGDIDVDTGSTSTETVGVVINFEVANANIVNSGAGALNLGQVSSQVATSGLASYTIGGSGGPILIQTGLNASSAAGSVTSLIKNGSDTLKLQVQSGINGTVSVTGGTFDLVYLSSSKAGALSSTSAISVSNGATLEIDDENSIVNGTTLNVINDSASLTIASGGTISLNGGNEVVGSLTLGTNSAYTSGTFSSAVGNPGHGYITGSGTITVPEPTVVFAAAPLLLLARRRRMRYSA